MTATTNTSNPSAANGQVAEPTQELSPLKRALHALKDMRTRLEAVEHAKVEPIAIIGIGCRFPGQADSADAYWRLLRDGVHAVREVPADRWDINAYYNPDPDAPGKMNTRWGAFLDTIDQFDPQFFGISPREANSLDPQQRLLIEVAWEALEHAGQAPDQLTGSKTGVFVGISTNDYQLIQRQANGIEQIDAYIGTGGAANVAAGRISYILGLRGPTIAIDTACSSSLVAVQLACQSLRSRQSNLALAGGVNALLSPDSTISLSKVRALAPDDRCKTFDAAADGYVRGEGCGMIVLKRLSDAITDGDNILALVRGAAVNHDGRSSGLTVPSGLAQQEAIRAALADSGGLTPLDISYAEAHGTGTPLGDPIEVRALAAVLGAGRSKDQPLLIGSVKTNIGHLESAAGISGLIKVVLSLLHREIPAHLHFTQPNPHIDWDALPVQVVTEHMAWPSDGRPRVACINSFGFSGTNAHIILQEAPAVLPRESASEQLGQLLVLSAKSETALRAQASRFAAHLAAHPELALADICHTAANGRAHFSHRLALTASSIEQATTRLVAFANEQSAAGITAGQTARPRIAFLCTGQGAQYPGMAAQLDATQPIFRAALDRCAAILQPLLDRPLREILFVTDPALGAAHPLHQTGYTQPALFAIEYALAELWRAWGVTPQALLGHSVGEYVAAVIAGVFSLEDGLKLIAARGRLMQALPAGGAMTALFAPADRVRVAIAPHAAQLAIAAVNGPEHTVISGVADAVQQIAAAFAAEGVRVQPLTVSHAFHSPLMAPMLAEFTEVASSVTYHAPQLPLFSNVTGALAGPNIATPEYWVAHVLAPVQFANGIAALAEAGYDTFIELGPHPVLLGLGQACLPAGTGTWAASLRRNRADWTQLLEGLGALFVAGVPINWAAVSTPEAVRRVALPTYPFQRRRYWFSQVAKPRQAASSAGEHPLLGRQMRSPLLRETLFETTLGAQQPPYLNDHRLYGAAIFPGAGYLEIALAAAATLGSSPRWIESLTIREPLQLPEDGLRTLQTLLTPEANGATSFQIVSFDAGATGAPSWQTHATGTVRTSANEPPAAVDLAALIAQHREALDIAAYYQQLTELGLEYGPAFRGITQIRRGVTTALGQITLPDAAEDGARYQIHPALLDACFHVVGAALPAELAQDLDTMYVPVAVEHLRFYQAAPKQLWCEARFDATSGRGSETLTVQLRLFDDAGTVSADLERLVLKRAPRVAWKKPQQNSLESLLYQRSWQAQPQQPAPAHALAGSWLIYADAHGLGATLADQLRAAGADCVTVAPGAATRLLALDSWQLDPSDPNAHVQLLRDAFPKSLPRGVLYLWGADAPLGQPTLDGLHAAQELACGSGLRLAQALVQREQALPQLWLVTRGTQAIEREPVEAAHAALWGLGSSIASEHPDLRCTCIDLDLSIPAGEAEQLLAEIAAPGAERQIVLHGGARHVARLTRLETQPALLAHGQPYQLALPARGTLDALTFQPIERRVPGHDEIEIEVRATGLNFRDVLNVLGMYPGDPGPPGLECAGVVTALGAGVTNVQVGQRVVAMGTRCFDSYAIVQAGLAAPIPASMSFAEAATIPTTFLTAAYGLQHLARIQPGERVLIHAAAGGVGLAAVQLALRAGAEVFATAGSAEKHAFLRKMGVQHIFSSRTLDFADKIAQITNGQGIDVVLNSLADGFITRSVELLAAGGRFLEIGKRGIWSAEQFAAECPHAAYYPFELGEILRDQPGVLEALLLDLVDQCAAGELHPLPMQIFPEHEIVDAFRFMAQARHIGKVVVTHRPLGSLVRADATYLITGGLGGLGLELAGWMVAQGARHLALVGRSAPSPAAQAALAALGQAGAEVRVLAADIGNPIDVARVLATIDAKQPALRGIVHAAGLLDDGVLTQQTWARFRRVLTPKADGAWLLDRYSSGLDLDFFVLFSSASALLGSPGQANYAAANACLDALAHQRRAKGLPALSINWGAWAQVGMAAALDKREQRRLADRGMGAIDPATGLSALGALMQQDAAQVAVLPISWPSLLAQFPADTTPAFLETMASAERHSQPAVHAQSSVISLADMFAAAPPEQHLGLVTEQLQRQVAEVLGIDLAELPAPQQSLSDLGLDSLMSVELKNRVETRLGVAMPVSVFLEGTSIEDLAALIAERLSQSSGIVIGEQAADISPSPTDVILDLDQLSDDEVNAMLSSLLAERGSVS